MKEHTRYLELRRAQCAHAPERHRHQLEALDGLLQEARAEADGLSYVRRTNNLFALARAEWLDRYQNQIRLCQALGDQARVRAAEIDYQAGELATGHADFHARIVAGRTRSAALELASSTCTSALAPLFIALLEFATEAAPVRRELRRTTARGLWQQIQIYDPGCTWERVCSYPPYRNRIPFDDQALQVIGGWLREVLGTAAVDVPPQVDVEASPPPALRDPEIERLPTVAEAAAGFHAAYDSIADDPRMQKTREVYQQIFALEEQAAGSGDFLCSVEERDLLCQLARVRQIELACDGLEHCAGLSQPHLERHYRALIEAVKQCRSRTEIELVCAHADACVAVESSWNRILLHYLFRAVVAAMLFEVNRSPEQRETVRKSYQAACRIFDLDWDSLFAIPRVFTFFAEIFFTKGQRLIDLDLSEHGVTQNEVGIDLLFEYRANALNHATDFAIAEGHRTAEAARARVDELLNSERFASPEAMREHVGDLFWQAMERAPVLTLSKAPRDVIAWGHTIRLGDLQEALYPTARPVLD